MSDIFKALQLLLVLFGGFFLWLFYRQRKVKFLSRFIPVKARLFVFDDEKEGTATVDGVTYQYYFSAGGRARCTSPVFEHGCLFFDLRNSSAWDHPV